MTVNELTRIDAWIYARITGDATLRALIGNDRAYPDVAPQDTDYPLVIFQVQDAGDDVRAAASTAANRVMVRPTYTIKGIAEQRTYGGVLADIADSIDRLFHQAPGGAAGSDGHVLTCTRDRALRYVDDTSQGTEFRHLGGLYVIEAQV